MKKTTRIVTFLIVLLMLVSCFAACNNKNNNKNNQTTPPPNNTTTTPPADSGYDLPEAVDLNGYTYKAYVRSNYESKNTVEDGNPLFACEDFWNEQKDANTDALNYAVYERNQQLQTLYNVKMRQQAQNGNMVEELKTFYQNGERFDLSIILAKSAAQAATQNLLKNLNSLEYLDLTHEAYDQNSIRELAMGGKLYYLSGDMNISTMEVVAPTIVNMKMYNSLADAITEEFEDEAYTDIYSLVLGKKWTMDTMMRIAHLATVDADTADGALDISKGDTLGYYQYTEATLYYFYAAGGRLTAMGEDGYPEFVVQNQTNQEVFNYIYSNFNKNTSASWMPNMPNGYSTGRKSNFFGGSCLFTEMTLWDVRKQLYYEEGLEYGVLPAPMKEDGGNYSACVYMYNIAHLWAIPSLCENEYNAQVMMQALAAHSNRAISGSTMYAYYTRTLYLSIAGENPIARRVMEVIQNSMVYDIAVIYDWGEWAKALLEIDTASTNVHGGKVSILQQTAIPQMEDTIASFKNPTALPD